MPRFGGVPLEEPRKPRFGGVPVQVEIVEPSQPPSRSWDRELLSAAGAIIPGYNMIAPPSDGMMGQFQQGLTMGWGDELNALKAGAGAMLPGGQSPADAYNATMQAQQAERALYEKSNPARAMVGEVAGGLAGAGKLGGAVKMGKSFIQAAPRLIGAGAAAGAVSGAGSADPGERTDGAVSGGLIGAAAGPLLMGGVRVAKDASKLVRNALSPSPGAADEAVVGALQRDGRSTKDILAALRDAPEGVPVSAADVSSPGVQSLLSGAAVTPGKAQQVVTETLESRLGEQGQRVRDAVGKAAGPRQYAVNLIEEVKASRWAKAAPLYQEAFKAGRVQSERVAEILKDPDVASAYAVAQKIAKREGVELAPIDAPDLRTLDYLKRGLDGKISAEFGSGGNPANAASLKKLRTEMVDIMDAQSPAYKAARRAYSSDSEVLEAVELGQKALNMGDGQLSVTLKGLKSGAEKEAFRKAALDSLTDRLNSKEGAGLLNDLMKSEKARRNLKLIVGNEKEYAALSKRLIAEQQIRNTGARVNPKVGSQTAMRQGDAGALPETMSMTQNLANKNWWALGMQGLNALKMRGQGLNDAAKGNMAEGLMTADKAQQAAYLKRLMEAEQRAAKAKSRKGFLGATTAGGNLAGLLAE